MQLVQRMLFDQLQAYKDRDDCMVQWYEESSWEKYYDDANLGHLLFIQGFNRGWCTMLWDHLLG